MLGKGDGGYVFGRDARGKHRGDAAGEHGGLARTRAGFDEEGAVMHGNGLAARGVISQRWVV